jgi:hypothetical protein
MVVHSRWNFGHYYRNPISVVERGQRPVAVGLERERGLGPFERHRHARLIPCVDPATLLPGGDGLIHAAHRLQFDAAASSHAAGLVADGSRGPEATPMAREIREVGVQGPYGTRGRRHAALHCDVTFRHKITPGVRLTVPPTADSTGRSSDACFGV